AQALPGTLAGVLGIALGYAAYGTKVLPLKAPAWLTSLLVRGYYLDDFYYGVVVRFSMALAPIAGWFDKRVVDGAVEGVAQVAVGASRVAGMVDQRVVDDAGNALGYTVTSTGAILRRLQTGSLGFYALLVALGAAVIGIVLAR
ncbi:MAG: hypothetical protein HY335_09010, partial [Deinococcus sp.]|nr:hypothetical protein [Deinococcus sp.]